MRDVSGGDIRTGTRPFVSLYLHLDPYTCVRSFSMSPWLSVACTPNSIIQLAFQFLISFPFASFLTHTTYQDVARDPWKYPNVGFIQMMPQWRRTVAQLPNTFLRRSSEMLLPAPGAANIHTSATSSTSPCCAQIQQPPSAFGRGYRGCTPPGSSSAQVNLFMVAPLNPVRPR